MRRLRPLDHRVIPRLPQGTQPAAASVPHWRPAIGEAGPAVVVTCECRTALFLNFGEGGRFSIDSSGLVQPSVGCWQCRWHTLATLQGWQGGDA